MFKNGEGWLLKPQSEPPKRPPSSTWVKDKNGWSVKVDEKSAAEVPPEKATDAKTPSGDGGKLDAEKSGKRNIDSARADKHKRLKKDDVASGENDVTAPACLTLGRTVLYGRNSNYVPVRVQAAPPAVDNVWVQYSPDLMTRLAAANPTRQGGQTVYYYAFLVLTISLIYLSKVVQCPKRII